ncbi:MAG: metallophosphoesterase [Clostridiales bacterium]|nr:metallophosphoesterase [Clostridiales bacterium]
MKKNKKKSGFLKKFLKVIVSIVLSLILLLLAVTCIGIVGAAANRKFISNSIKPVEYDNQLVPALDENGDFNFVTDREFHILQLTDIHIGAGFLSIRKDSMAINAVCAMISAEKPDLVVVTGDIAYPIHVQAGTINNKRSAVMFAEAMEKLGVYWCLTFGNHDTEDYSFYTREEIGEIYMNRELYPHCLLQSGPSDISGFGNYVINIKNSKGELIQSLFMLDSNMYTEKRFFGLYSEYDCVHADQVDWYKNKLVSLKKDNNDASFKSIMFMHIPPKAVKDAYNEYRENNYSDTEDVKYLGGKLGEENFVICSGDEDFGLFDACVDSGSTQALFFGHDHLNSFGINYKGVDLRYSYSIDYLAYIGIAKFGAQRGCSLITVKPDGSYAYSQENYYQDKYISSKPKEEVTLEDMYEVENSDGLVPDGYIAEGLRSLLDLNLKSNKTVVNSIFVNNCLPYDSETVKEIDGKKYYLVTDKKYKNYGDLESFINNVYTKNAAEKIMKEYNIYKNEDGKLFVLSSAADKMKGQTIDYDSHNFEVTDYGPDYCTASLEIKDGEGNTLKEAEIKFVKESNTWKLDLLVF